MDWRAADKLIFALIGILAAVAAYDVYQLLRTAEVNRALPEVKAGAAVPDDHPHLRFARAWALQQNGDFDAALEAYAAIAVPESHRLRDDIRYNIANLYLRRAFEFRRDGADDLALPLVELAKEYYRDLLRGDSRDWAAKYNLELALRLSPDVDVEAAEEERNPEHNPRSAAGIQVRKRLP